jgi:hypothetical protein
VGASDNDVPLHQSIAADMLRAGRSVEDAAATLRDLLGRPLTDEERRDLEAAKALADAIAASHGSEYHGFGNPPAH